MSNIKAIESKIKLVTATRDSATDTAIHNHAQAKLDRLHTELHKLQQAQLLLDKYRATI